jgi:hypothetical protein
VAGLTAALLALGAIALSRRVEDAVDAMSGLGLWIAAAAELMFLTVHASTPAHLRADRPGRGRRAAGGAPPIAWPGAAWRPAPSPEASSPWR